MVIEKDFVIIGGGLAGLSAAWKLYQNNQDFLLLESKDSVGGWVQPLKNGPALFDQGPKSFRLMTPNMSLFHMLESLNLVDQIVIPSSSSSERYILYQNKLERVPDSFVSLAKSKLARGVIKSYIRSFFYKLNTSTDMDSISEFLTPIFSEKVLSHCIDPMITGIYAGDIEKLCFKECFPNQYAYIKKYRNLFKGVKNYSRHIKSIEKPSWVQNLSGSFFSLKGGMHKLINNLADKLSKDISTSSSVNQIKPSNGGYDLVYKNGDTLKKLFCKKIIIATPASIASNLLFPIIPKVQYLQDLDYSSITSVYCSWDEKQTLPNGFGCLIPSIYKNPLIGVIFDSNLFTQQFENNTPTRVTCMLGGAHHPNIFKLSNQAVQNIALDFLKNHCRVLHPPKHIAICHQKDAIPQFGPGHQKSVASIQSILKKQFSITLCGSYTHGVSIADVIHSGYTAANNLL